MTVRKGEDECDSNHCPFPFRLQDSFRLHRLGNRGVRQNT